MDQALPPGFRFHPTDEELVIYYLRNQFTSSKSFPASSIIPKVDIYKFDPWELPEKAEIGEKEWYFLSPRERKYPNGVRPNRATLSGYWKATGTDKAIYGKSKPIGVKKSLVFYTGKPPKGIKTGWIMHEYRLVQSSRTSQANCDKHAGSTSMRLDDWAVCRIYKKKKKNIVGKTIMEEEKLKQEFPSINETTVTGNSYQNEQEMMMKKLISMSNLHNDDNNNNRYLGSSSVSSQTFCDGRYDSSFDLRQNNHVAVDASCFVKPRIFADHNNYGEACAGNNKIQVMMKQSGGRTNSNQPMFVNNQVYDL